MIFTFLSPDVRPGYASRREARQIQIEAEREQIRGHQKNTTVKALESSHRESALQTSIGSDNKGFSMLAKMGYCMCFNIFNFLTSTKKLCMKKIEFFLIFLAHPN